MFDKQNIGNRAEIPKEEILFACSSKYFGGISTEFIDKPEQGFIGLTKDKIVFVNLPFKKKNQKVINIPLNKINKSEIKQMKMEDADKDNFMTAMSYFAGHGPISTYKHSIFVVSIPYEDTNSQKQTPLFFIEKANDFSKELFKLL